MGAGLAARPTSRTEGTSAPTPPKGPGAREPGNQETTRQQLPTNSHAMTTLFLPAPSLMHTRGRPSVACLFQSSDDEHRLPVHRLSRLHRIGPADFFPFPVLFSFSTLAIMSLVWNCRLPCADQSFFFFNLGFGKRSTTLSRDAQTPWPSRMSC